MQLTVDPDLRGRLDVDGRPIAWAKWAPRPSAGAPILLVHGASAHLGWWDAVVVALTAARRTVITVELSGHGDSAHRDVYSGDQWAREVLAVAASVAEGPVLLVGHSLGGRVSSLAAARGPALIPRLMIVDAALTRPGGPRPRRIPPRLGPRGVHPTLQAAVEAFHLRPREPVADTELLRRVAAGAHRQVDGGWTLKADLTVFNRVDDEEIASALAAVDAPLTFVYGTQSTVSDPEGRSFLVDTHAGPTELVALDGHHHLTFDQAGPLADLIAARAAPG